MDDQAKRIVDIVITKEALGVTAANFSTPLFLSDATAVVASVKTYSSLKQVLEDYTNTDNEYWAAGAHFAIVGAPAKFKIAKGKTGVLTLTDTLNEIIAIDNDWYGLCTEVISDSAKIEDAAEWCELNDKFLFTGDNRAVVLNNTDVTSTPYTLNTNSRVRSHCIYNSKLRDVASKAGGYADVAFASKTLGMTVGSYTTVFKTLPKQTADKFTYANIATLDTKHTSYYQKIYGSDRTFGGRTCGGALSDWVDVEIGIDWLATRMQEAVVNVIFAQDKVSYTDEGIALIKAAVVAILQNAVNTGLLATYEVKAQSASLQTQADKASRTYNGITWTATLAGAIHSTTINGKVSV
jgi:hypothetical protein